MSQLPSFSIERDYDPGDDDVEIPPLRFKSADGTNEVPIGDFGRSPVGEIVNDGNVTLEVSYKLAIYTPEDFVFAIDIIPAFQPIPPGKSLPVLMKSKQYMASGWFSRAEDLGIEDTDPMFYRVFPIAKSADDADARTPVTRPTEIATIPATESVPPTETAVVSTVEPTETAVVSQISEAFPEMVIPGGLQLVSGQSYGLERAEVIELSTSDSTTPRAVGNYSAEEVAFFLNHRDFMGGGPYREVQALLSAPASPFFTHFADPSQVVEILRQYSWQAGYLRIFTFDGPPVDHAGWVEASAHRFASVEDAQRGSQYLADQFAIVSGFTSVALPTDADTAFAYSGPGYNGNETAVFAQQGNFVIVVIGVAPLGSPDSTIQVVVDSAVAVLQS